MTRLVHDLGVTVVLAEHRLERVVQYADRVIEVRADGTVAVGRAGAMLATAKVAPPMVELGRLAGWEPLPLSVRDARRDAGPLRERIAVLPVRPVARPSARQPSGAVALRLATSSSATDRVVAVRGVDLELCGARSRRSWVETAQGSHRCCGHCKGRGHVRRRGRRRRCRSRSASPRPRARAWSGWCHRLPPTCSTSTAWPRSSRRPITKSAGTALSGARALLDRLAPGIPTRPHPRDLSEGQRLALVLAIQLAAAPRWCSSTSRPEGSTIAAKRALSGIIDQLAAEGHAVVDLQPTTWSSSAAGADRVVVMAGRRDRG